MREEEKAIEEAKKLGEEAAEELVKKLSDYVREDPEGCLKLFKGYLSGVRRAYKKLYEKGRIQLRVSFPPHYRYYFEFCVNYAYSKNWIKRPTYAEFSRWAIKQVIAHILKKEKKERGKLARAEELRS